MPNIPHFFRMNFNVFVGENSNTLVAVCRNHTYPFSHMLKRERERERKHGEEFLA
jgi:hypothetical protein